MIRRKGSSILGVDTEIEDTVKNLSPPQIVYGPVQKEEGDEKEGTWGGTIPTVREGRGNRGGKN